MNIWIETQTDWVRRELGGAPAYRLVGGAEPAIDPIEHPQASFDCGDVILSRIGDSNAHWALICRPFAARINNDPVAAGLRMLQHKDEIRQANLPTRFLYSTEAVATITAHTGPDVECPRCFQPIVEGTPTVRCPNCSISYHQDIDRSLPCWTFCDFCQTCNYTTDINAGFNWPPETW